MGKNSLVEKATLLLGPILEREGLELFELNYKRKQNRWVLEVFISRPGSGITLDDCQNVSRALSLELEVEDLFEDSAVLEVSSVGLDRSLKDQRDFQYFCGELVKIKSKKRLHDKRVFLGVIKSCDENAVTLGLTEEKLDVVIPYHEIAKAKLEVSF